MADRTLKRSFKKRIMKNRDIEEPVWMTKDILMKIKERKALNREKRNERDIVKKGQLEELYVWKKRQVQVMIQEAMTTHELKITKDIKQDKRRKVWDNIKLLRGQGSRGEEDIGIYDQEGNKLGKETAEIEVERYWGSIYMKHENKIAMVWNEEEKQSYLEELENEQLVVTQGGNFQYNIREHLDMAVMVENQIEPMQKPEFTTQKVKKVIQKLKCRKAAGPDGIKPELYKALLNENELIEMITNSLNYEIAKTGKPSEWKLSRTKMLEKKKKPTAKDLRPIALTDISYKLFMSLIKNEIEEHLVANKEIKETQAGFTNGGRGEDNLFLLQYCVEESYKRRTPLVVVSIDYSKAYDSIKREKIIEVMRKYKIHPQIIEAVSGVYINDRTVVEIGHMKKEMRVSSGIRQGCTGSTTIFKLITYEIIRELERKGQGFMNEYVEILALFFADDGLLIADSISSAKHNIKILKEVSRACGLEINTAKSNIVIFNSVERPETLEEIEVRTEFKYLGVELVCERDMFRKQIENMIAKAQRLANVTYSIINKCCNKVLIGKTFWKSVVVPAILYASCAINIGEKDIDKLQVIENGVYRKILGAPKYAPNCTLRGEIGASLMKTRIVEGRLQYIRSIWERKNDLLKIVLEDQFERPGRWMKKTKEWMNYVGITRREMQQLGKNGIKEKVRAKDTESWKKELEKKCSITLYKSWKTEIREEQIYDNRTASEILYRARCNCLLLEDRNRHTGGEIVCKVCKNGVEDLAHFILECKGWVDIRRKAPSLQRPYPEDTSNILGHFLFAEESLKENKEVLYDMWRKRTRLLKIENQ